MKLGKRLKRWIHREQFERDLADELRFHSEMSGRQQANAGTLEKTRQVSHFVWFESCIQDLKFAIRGFMKRPAFPFTVIGTIGLALGLNTTLFTIANAYIFRPFAVADPYSLYRLSWYQANGNQLSLNWPEYQEVARHKNTFAGFFADEVLVLRVGGVATFGDMVSGDYFRVMGVYPQLGRTFTLEDDDAPGKSPVIVISDAVWRNRLGRDPNVIGRKIQVRAQNLEVIGVMRPEFSGTESLPVDFWIPLSMSPFLDSGPSIFGPIHPRIIGVMTRFKPGLDLKKAQAQANLLASRAGGELTGKEKVTSAQLTLRATALSLNGQILKVFTPLLVVFALVLLIACANVANMMLARALGRQREIGVRLSLGAGRSRLVRQLLTESLALAVPASLAGFLIAVSTISLGEKVMYSTLPPEVARIIHIVDLAPDFRVLLFLMIAGAICTVGFGLAPALQATRLAVAQASRGDFSNQFRPSKLRNALVISQVSACALLLICSVLILRDERDRTNRDTHLSLHPVVDVSVQEQLQRRVAKKLQQQRWVEAVAPTARAPLSGLLYMLSVSIPGSPKPVRAGYNFVSPEYFDVLRIPVVRGRNFTADEGNAEAHVAIVSERTAAQFWPGTDAIGQTIELPTDQQPTRFFRLPGFTSARVIGIARDVISGAVGDGIDPTIIYFPTSILHSGNRSLLVRVKGNPEALMPSFDEALQGEADLINPLEEIHAVQIYPFQVALWVTLFLGGLALVLTVSGIYGVLSYLVSQRTKEIGIRMALGASTRGMVRLVLSQSMRLVLSGIALGTILAMGASRLIISQLEVLKRFDWVAYTATAMVILLASLAASLFPSLRASRVDPAATLRAE